MARSNPFPGSRLKKLRTPQDYALAQLVLDEIDGKITAQEADARRKRILAQSETSK